MDNLQDKDRKGGKRRPLSAELIAAEAMRLIDEQGLDGFSFRTLAARLGCQAMSLYHYYPSKAHLYEALVDICIGEITISPPGRPWRERLFDLAQSYRQTALRHPGFFLYFAVFRLNNRSGMAFLEAMVRVFEDSGLGPEAVARHFRAIGYYLIGAGLDEVMGYRNAPSALEPVDDETASRDYPSIASLGPYFGKGYHAKTFDAGLNALLDRMEAEAGREGTGQAGAIAP